ncbi:hypothetical protein GCM10009590_16790 [Brachybacterium alimentarium]
MKPTSTRIAAVMHWRIRNEHAFNTRLYRWDTLESREADCPFEGRPETFPTPTAGHPEEP